MALDLSALQQPSKAQDYGDHLAFEHEIAGEAITLKAVFRTGRMLTLHRRLGESILIIKRFIQDNYDIPYDAMKLFYKSTLLVDPLSLNDYSFLASKKVAVIRVETTCDVPMIGEDAPPELMLQAWGPKSSSSTSLAPAGTASSGATVTAAAAAAGDAGAPGTSVASSSASADVQSATADRASSSLANASVSSAMGGKPVLVASAPLAAVASSAAASAASTVSVQRRTEPVSVSLAPDVSAALRWPLPPRADPLLVREAGAFLRPVQLRVRLPAAGSAAGSESSSHTTINAYLGETVAALRARLADDNEAWAQMTLRHAGSVLLDPLSLNDFPAVVHCADRGEPVDVDLVPIPTEPAASSSASASHKSGVCTLL